MNKATTLFFRLIVCVILSIIGLGSSAHAQVNVIRGPYLQMGTPTSVVIKWRTSAPTQSIVDFGINFNTLNSTVSDNTLKTEHELNLTSLSPNTKYYYSIRDNAGILVPKANDLYLKTSPTPGSTQCVRAWVLGDCGTKNNTQRSVRDAYYEYAADDHTDMILFLGDNAYNQGTDNEYQAALFENMYEDKLKNTVAWSTLGNHDGLSTNNSLQTGPYYDIFTFPTNGEAGGIASGTEAYYSFDYANIHFIVLESYQADRSVGGAMYNWALSDIQNTTQEWIVAMWHHPPYTKGSHNSDTERQLFEMRENFLPMLELNGIDLVLSGHSHSYERSYFLNGHYGKSNTFNSNTHTVSSNGYGDGRIEGDGAYSKTSPEGAVYITAGSSGKKSIGQLNHNAMYYSVKQLGSCVLEVCDNKMDVKFLRETGVVEDFFTITKGPQICNNQSCDDSNPCTVNDVLDANCDCAGTYLDTDGDGVCDPLDPCDDSIPNNPCEEENTFVTLGDRWHYFDESIEPLIDNGVEWYGKNYDDDSWALGNAHFGYGETDETTKVNSSAKTVYFRHYFEVENPTTWKSINMDLIYDDGAVVYINGVEMWRQNMPSGPIDYNTFSLVQSAENEFATTIVTSNLIEGMNTVAVEIHQVNNNSSDISFDFELIAKNQLPPNPSCDDNDCTTTDSYDEVAGVCVNTPNTPPSCDDNNCLTTDNYNTTSCTCINTPITVPNCDDNDCATIDSFNPASCTCEHIPITIPDCSNNNCIVIQSGNSVITQSTFAEISIVSDGVVIAGSDIEFKAGKNIQLIENFEVESGAVFHAYIELQLILTGCDDNDCTTTDGYDVINCECVHIPIVNLSCDDGDANTINDQLQADCECRGESPPNETSLIGNFLWNDINGDGCQDSDEPGLNGIEVELLENGIVIQSMVTTIDPIYNTRGWYEFEVSPGEYAIRFGPHTSSRFITAKDNCGKNVIDSDADVQSSETDVFTVEAGMNYFDLDAGYTFTQSAKQ